MHYKFVTAVTDLLYRLIYNRNIESEVFNNEQKNYKN